MPITNEPEGIRIPPVALATIVRQIGDAFNEVNDVRLNLQDTSNPAVHTTNRFKLAIALGKLQAIKDHIAAEVRIQQSKE